MGMERGKKVGGGQSRGSSHSSRATKGQTTTTTEIVGCYGLFNGSRSTRSNYENFGDN